MTDSLIFGLPLLVMAGLLMALPAPLSAALRRQAAATLLTTLMLALLFSLLMIRMQSGTDVLNTSRMASTALVMLVAGLIAAPLLDRARTGGVVVAAVAAGIVTVPLFLHGLLPKLPAIYGVALLYALLIVSVLVGIGGSMQLPLSAERFTAQGARRVISVNGGLIAGGWVVIALALLILGWSMLPPDAVFTPLPLLVSGIVSSFVQLASTRAEDAIRKAGEGFAAGILIVLMGTYTLEYALVSGLAAGFFVMRAEAITTALRIDDAQHLTGIILIPSLLGLLMPALLGTADVSAAISWLAVSCLLGVVLPLLLWPLIKLTVGLATR